MVKRSGENGGITKKIRLLTWERAPRIKVNSEITGQIRVW